MDRTLPRISSIENKDIQACSEDLNKSREEPSPRRNRKTKSGLKYKPVKVKVHTLTDQNLVFPGLKKAQDQS